MYSGPNLFFTGTDTGVGKTWVTAAVARLLRQQSRDVRVCKPVATDARWVDGRWRADDTLALAKAAGSVQTLEEITPWALPEPLAPAVAARRQGVSLTLEALVLAVQSQRRPGTALLVEGVGGLLCPLTERATVADLALSLDFPLVVVTRRSLGTLNHTLLTLEVAQTRGLTVAGVVVNESEPPHTLAEATNLEELQRWVRVPVLALAPYQQEAALARVDWWQLGFREPAPPGPGLPGFAHGTNTE